VGDLPERNVLSPSHLTFLSSGNVNKADRPSASVCICLNIACAGVSSFDLLFFKVWERLDSQPTKEALSPL